MSTTPSFSLKDQLFNPEKVAYLTELLVNAHPDFPASTFQHQVVNAFPALELKARIAHIAECLRIHLPGEYPAALDILLRSLPPELDPNKTDDDFGDFIFAPLALFVAQYGCNETHLDRSLRALREITKRFSAEDAVRYFINAFPEETFRFLAECATDEHYHVRRLASEGTRAKLPWAQKLTTDYRKPLPILDMLYADQTRYVTRSVANHLNDISKVDPALVVETLGRWQESGAQSEKEMAFIAKHALRTLIKQGNPDALKLLGYGAEPDITIAEFATSTPVVQIGSALEFSLTIRAHSQQKLLIDYLMLFAADEKRNGGKSGKKRGQKVFKLKQLALGADEVITLTKRHPLRPMTTRRLYPGTHRVTVQINGQTFDSFTFELVDIADALESAG